VLSTNLDRLSTCLRRLQEPPRKGRAKIARRFSAGVARIEVSAPQSDG